MEIELFVPGTPISQGSKNAFVKNGIAVLAESGGARHKKWRAKVAAACVEAAKEHEIEQTNLLDGPCEATLAFFFEKPKSKPAWKHLVDVKPDIDKLSRSILDSITKTIVTNDSRVVKLTAEKHYGDEEGVWIIVKTIKERDDQLFEV